MLAAQGKTEESGSLLYVVPTNRPVIVFPGDAQSLDRRNEKKHRTSSLGCINGFIGFLGEILTSNPSNAGLNWKASKIHLAYVNCKLLIRAYITLFFHLHIVLHLSSK